MEPEWSPLANLTDQERAEVKKFEDEPKGRDLFVALVRLTKKDPSLMKWATLVHDEDDCSDDEDDPDSVQIGDIDWLQHSHDFPSIDLFVMMNFTNASHRIHPLDSFKWLNKWKDLLFFRFMRGRLPEMDRQQWKNEQDLAHWLQRLRDHPEIRPQIAEMLLNTIDPLWEGVSKKSLRDLYDAQNKEWKAMYDQLLKFRRAAGRLPQNPQSKLFQWLQEQKALPHTDLRRALADHVEEMV